MRKKRLLSGLLAVAMTLSVLSGTVTALATETLPEEVPAVSGEEQEELPGEGEEPDLTEETPEEPDEEPETPEDTAGAEETEQPEDADAEQPGEVREEESVSAKSAAAGISVQTVSYENVQWTNEDGVSFMVDFDQTGQTAFIWKVLKNDSVPTCVFPTEIEYDNTTYTVTTVKLIGQQTTGYSAVVLPEKLETFAGEFGISFPGVTKLTIPGTVTSLTASLQGMASLKTLTIEEGVSAIGTEQGFARNCRALKTVVLPSTLKKISGSYAFSGDSALEEIDLKNLTSLNTTGLFEDCTSLKEVALPSCVRSIGNSMFKGCTMLETVTAAGTISSVGSDAFCGDGNLTSVPNLSSATAVGARGFKDCRNLTDVGGLGALYQASQSLGESAFENCENLHVYAYLTMSKIPARVFKNVPGVQYVIFTSYASPVSIGDEAFMNTSIVKVTIPASVKTIGKNAFAGTQLAGTLSLPDKLESIGERAFADTLIDGVYIGAKVRTINSGAFAGCANLKNAYIENKADAVEFAADAFDKGTNLVWAQQSRPRTNDRISEEEDAPTLQEAVTAAAKTGGTVELKRNVTLTSAVTVPAGKTVTITSHGGYEIYGDSSELSVQDADGPLRNLFVVEDGASVIFDGDLTLFGRYNTGSVILNYGSATLSGDVTVKGSRISNDRANGTSDAGVGVIDSRGTGAVFTMEGGTITDNMFLKPSSGQDVAYSGIVRASDGARISIREGKITGNSADAANALSCSPGVLLYNSASGEMTDGEISYNAGHRGTGIMLLTIPDRMTGSVEFRMSGGSIHNNTGSSSGRVTAGGAVHVEGSAQFTMTGGDISYNRGGSGGGVTVVDTGLQGSGSECGTAFVLDGGNLIGNYATSGGGIYSYSNGVRLLSGRIEYKKANKQVDGVYSEGNTSHYSTIYLENALITENTAVEQGGGVWFCPTGRGKIYVSNGAAIYNNTAKSGAAGAGDDFAASASAEYTVTLADRMLGGGRVHWYQDGTIYGEIGQLPDVQPGSSRYNAAEAEVEKIVDYAQPITLKGFAAEGAIEAANASAKLYIQHNDADAGGGVGANGGVVIGEDTVLTDLTVHKEWDDDEDALSARPESVTVELKDLSGHVLDSAVLSEENDWSHTFAELPLGVYTAAEQEVPEGYRESLRRNSDGSLTIVNILEPEEPHEPGHISILPDPLDPDPGPEEPGEEPGTEEDDPENPRKPRRTIPEEEDPEHPETGTPGSREQTPEDPEEIGEEQQETGTTVPEAGGTAETTDETTPESRATEERIPEKQTAEDKRPRLIQTGQPWQPVWALAAAGAALTAVGLWLTKRRK